MKIKCKIKNLSAKLSILIFVTFGSAALSACGGSDTGQPSAAGSASSSEPDQAHQVFISKLQPLNADWNAGKISGSATFLIDGGTFTADVKMQGMGGPFPHLMQIHESGICPSTDPAEGADSNGDGVIDESEGSVFYGRSLIALNQALSNGDTDLKSFASTDDNGVLGYHAVTSYHQMMNQIRAEGESDLNLPARTLVIYGVVETSVPASAFHFPGMTLSQSLPVACGVIKTVSLAE